MLVAARAAPVAGGDSTRAHALLVAAEAREAQLDEAGHARLVAEAFHADPSYVPAQLALMGVFGNRLTAAEQRRYLAGIRGLSPADSACLSFRTAAVPGASAWELPRLRAVERRFGRTACTELLDAEWESDLAPPSQPPDLLTERWPRALAGAGASGPVWVHYVSVLLDARDTASAEQAVRRGLARAIELTARVDLYGQLAAIRGARGDRAGADSARRAIDEMAARDGSPEARYLMLERKWIAASGAAQRRRFAPAEAFAARYHAMHHMLSDWLDRGGRLADAGDPDDAIRYFHRALSAADSLGWEPMRVRAMTALGRAYMKAGRWTDAIRILRLALPLCDPDNLYYAAEVHHNLAHAYQGTGRMDRALDEVNRFVTLADSMPGDGIHMISLYDAGVIRWEAGRHASARVAFDEMVRVIDARRANYFYAGDYYERIGDLTRALRYYRQVPRSDGEEGARALSGLTRVYDALGMRDSAEAAARAHDREAQTPEEVPLLPEVLVAHGEAARALDMSRAWADTQIARANVRGAVRAKLQLAWLLLDARAPRQALTEAHTAGALASRANFPEERARAMTLQAAAKLAMGDAGSAAQDAQIAVREARDQGTDEDRRDAEAALGDALAQQGRTTEALAAYDAAARVVESMARSVTADLPSARFHARQQSVFDRAVALLLREPSSPARIGELLAWLQRRGAAAYPGAATGGVPLSLSAIHARLAPDQALVNYVMLDHSIAAFVVTRRHAAVVPLAAAPARVDTLVNRVRRPFATSYMGRVDLAHAVADSGAAAELGRLLLAPIAGYLEGARRLAVVPDGSLHLLPFDLLPLAGDTLVVDRLAVSVLPSVRFLSSATARLATRASLLLVGGDAPGAEREVSDVRAEWTRGPVRTLTSAAATETAIRDDLPRFTVLHFATHAVVDDNDPLASRLVLAPEASADGLFDVSDIEAAASHARLVVLSACESENGQSFAGVGPIGLARAFLVGGAQAVLATQWPVTADAADLMRAFYARLTAGVPPDEALRDAKETLRRDPRTASPFYWAGFVLVGDAGSL